MRDLWNKHDANTVRYEMQRWLRERVGVRHMIDDEHLAYVVTDAWLHDTMAKMVISLHTAVYRRDLETRVVRVPLRWQDAFLDSLAPCLPRWLRRRLPRPKVHLVLVQAAYLLVPNRWAELGPVLETQTIVGEEAEP